MYLLPKIHKDRKVWPGEGKVPPGRPIIADCGSESYASAEYIDHFLAPLAKQHKSYLKDTNDFITKIAEIKAKEGAFIATIDVDSLCTNIDNTNGLEAVKQIFNKNPDPNRPDKEILELLKINLENNDFEFNSHLFLAEWEEKALEKCVLKPSESMHFLNTVVYKGNRFKETGTFDTKRYFGTVTQENTSPKPYF